MLTRRIETALRDYLLHANRALLITGARQTGKTFIIRKVGKECFKHFVEINFIVQKEAVELFNNAKNAHDLLMRISAFVHESLVPGETLIFFDEVQACPEIITMIKFLVDEGSYKYVMSGSLLGVELQDIRSVPVGYMGEMQLYPLDLEEFAKAIGIGDNVFEHLQECYKERRPVDDFVHKRMMDMVYLYLIIGGMPASVQKYVDTNNLRHVLNIQNDIISEYKKDITQYDRGNKLKIEEIYDLIPSELNNKNKRFILKELNEKARFNKYENSFLWLQNAGVAIPAYNVEEPKVPLLLSKQRNLFKLFLNDVGLLAAMYGGNIQLRLLNNDPNINYGAVFENFVAQELNAHGFSYSNSLYYFNSKKQGELDFVVEHNDTVLPIEVKSGKDFARHQALNNVLSNEEYQIKEALVLCHNNVSIENNVTYLPIYMTMFLQKEEIGDITFKFDLTGLNG